MSRWAMEWTTVISSDEVPDMMELMLWVILVLVMVSAALNMAMYSRIVRKERAYRADEEVQKLLDEALRDKLLYVTPEEGHDDGQVQKAEEVRDRDMSRAMDEGFDSIMRYTVNLGRGRTTGGEPL